MGQHALIGWLEAARGAGAFGSIEAKGAGKTVSLNEERATGQHSDPVDVRLPDYAPQLTPRAARVLLRLLLHAHEKQDVGGGEWREAA